jgi:DNA repair protein RecO (recombination protein O)
MNLPKLTFMKFVDEGYIINCRKHGEKSLILTVVCKHYGKVCGYVKSGISAKTLAVFQQGNLVKIDAWSRVDDNMLLLKVELITPYAVNFLNDVRKLSALSCLCALGNDCLPELQPLEDFYNRIDRFIQSVAQENWLTYYAFFEFHLLDFLGIGLDLSECSATGRKDDLAYVSPKSAKAVCREAGLPYRDRLFPFPHFIVENRDNPPLDEVLDSLKMTGFFLKKNFFLIHNLKFPDCRANLAEIIAKA